MDSNILYLPLKAAISYLQEQHYNNTSIGKRLGVTKLQVHYYHRGKTLQPSARVCMNFLKEFNILLTLYKTVEELEHHYAVENGA